MYSGLVVSCMISLYIILPFLLFFVVFSQHINDGRYPINLSENQDASWQRLLNCNWNIHLRSYRIITSWYNNFLLRKICFLWIVRCGGRRFGLQYCLNDCIPCWKHNENFPGSAIVCHNVPVIISAFSIRELLTKIFFRDKKYCKSQVRWPLVT